MSGGAFNWCLSALTITVCGTISRSLVLVVAFSVLPDSWIVHKFHRTSRYTCAGLCKLRMKCV